MLVTPLPMVTEVRPEQQEKAPHPMLVTLSGRVIEVRPEQPRNAYAGMISTLSPNVIVVRLEHPEKIGEVELDPYKVQWVAFHMTEVSPEQL